MNLFSRVASACAQWTGTPPAFTTSLAVVVLWGMTGPFFDYSDTWQLIINTGTTVVTFWMVFLIQASQNRDVKALHAKLDELVHATAGARDHLIRAEDSDEAEIEEKRLDPGRECEDTLIGGHQDAS